MRNKILGWVGVIWGGGIVAGTGFRLATGQFQVGSAYDVGLLAGVALGVLLFSAGVKLLLRERVAAPPNEQSR